jgi:hypothetical protein
MPGPMRGANNEDKGVSIMRAKFRTALWAGAVVVGFAAIGGTAAAGAQTTGKERLSDKASDDQRVDNCHVPVERRGSEPRPGCKDESRSIEKAAGMTTRASGSFDVKLKPMGGEEKIVEGASLGRMQIEKHFGGDLHGSSKGEMLSAMSTVKGSAGYVAIERVVGSLQGRAGSFVLQHNGVATRGAQQLSIIIVPDSGTGQLSGISGTMNIRIVEGKHYYDLDYAIEGEK